MTTLREASNQALEALAIGQDAAHEVAQTYHEAMAGYRPARHIAVDDDVRKIEDAITALRAALAEYDKDRVKVEEMKANWALQRKLAEETQERDKQQREYEEQRLAALAEPMQEPVANDDEVICPACCHQFRAIPPNVQQLMLNAGFKPPFTAPPQRKPLTEEEPVAWLWPHQLAELKEWKNEGNIRAWSGRHYKPDGVIPVYAAPPKPEERNFCPRCGKRTQDIHTCTPP